MRLTGRAASSAWQAAGLVAVMLAVTACEAPISSAAPARTGDKPTLTLYSAQHGDLMTLMVAGFTKSTGIKVNMRNGEDLELGSHLVQEGNASPADVFVTENSPAMTLVAGKGLLSTVDDAALAQVPVQFDPADKTWVGFAARATVFAYNATSLAASDLPTSIMDLGQPKWKDRVGISPAGADFQAIVSAVLALRGEVATVAWLKGLKDNARIYSGDTAVMKAVDVGEIESGVFFHNYWYEDQAESGASSGNVELLYFGHKDPGAFLSVSGAAVMKSSKHQAEAQQLVRYLSSAAGQKILADSPALEYPIGSGAPAGAVLRPLNELGAPAVPVASLDGQKAVELMRQARLL